MLTLSPNELPPISPSAMKLAERIRREHRSREEQRSIAARHGDEVKLAVLVQQWADSLGRWIKHRDDRDKRAAERAVLRCRQHVREVKGRGPLSALATLPTPSKCR